MRVRALTLAATLALLAGCAAQQGQFPQQDATGAAAAEAGGIGSVSDAADARTRAKAHTDLGSAYFEHGNMAVALEEARIALAADPTYAPAYNVQGLVNMALRDNAGAEQSFQRGLKLAPQDPDLNHNYGWFLCTSNRADQSIQWFMNAVRNPLYATPARSYAAAGRCTLDRSPKDAADYFDRALRLDPNNLMALLPYAEMKYKSGQLREARDLVTRYNKLVADPTAESLWLGLRIERKLGDTAAENGYATQLRRRYANSPEYQALQRGNFD